MKALLFLFLALPALASETPLLDRTYRVKVQAGTFACRDGIPPNGHNYPVYTSLTFTLPSFDLWLSDVWTNVSEYRADVQYEKCSEFPKLLRPAPEQNLIGTVTQKITETHHLTGQPGDARRSCMRETREEATLVVDGVTFRGVNTFLVGPMDPALCR